MAPPRALPELMEDAVTEILLRVPPDEPADLIRASLVCKPWLRIISDPAFLRRYRAFHRSAPLLGFFYYGGGPCSSPPFIPTTAAAPPLRRPAYDGHNWRVCDCRHGRVVLVKALRELAVWDPITGHQEELPKLNISYTSFTPVLICAVAGCDHRDCHGGPFLVVCVGRDHTDRFIRACVYSSEARAWVTPDWTDSIGGIFNIMRPAVVGDAIYCLVNLDRIILKYDWVKHCFSVIKLPMVYLRMPLLMQNEDGSLGFGGVSDSKLYLWSRMVDPEGVAGWVQQRVIKLKTLSKATVFGFIEGAGVLLMSTKAGAFMLELKSERVKKVGECMDYSTFLPFISFFTPDYARGELPSTAETN